MICNFGETQRYFLGLGGEKMNILLITLILNLILNTASLFIELPIVLNIITVMLALTAFILAFKDYKNN